MAQRGRVKSRQAAMRSGTSSACESCELWPKLIDSFIAL